MKICVRDAFTSYSYSKEYSFDLTLSDLPAQLVSDSVHVNVTVTALDGTVTCETVTDAVFMAECGRCLRRFELPLSITSKKLVRRDADEDFEDVIYVDGGLCIDIDEEIRAQLYFEFPTKPLCSDDCKGLCPVCGCDLNEKSCSCDIRTTGPRLAVLKKLIDKS